MKPHEERWAYDSTIGDVERHDGRPVAGVYHDMAGPLIAAAPDMARALMAVLEYEPGEYVDHTMRETMRAVLRRAGVLL